MSKRIAFGLILGIALISAFPAYGLDAPGAPGVASVWAPSRKSMLGTSVGGASRVYFTGYRGIVSEVFFPVVDTVNTVDLQFLVGDSSGTFVDEEKLQPYEVTRPDGMGLLWQAVTSNSAHHWRVTKYLFTDPTRNALIQRTTFQALDGHSVRDFKVYILHNPAMDNSGAGDTSHTTNLSGRTLLVASQGTRASALGVSRPWTIDGTGRTMVSQGFAGVSDGWIDLLGAGANKQMDWVYDRASGGNVTQMGWVDFAGSQAASIDFDVTLAFGLSEDEAMATASAVLNDDIAKLETQYQNEWKAYSQGLSTQNGLADNQYYLAAMSLKAIQDKSNGAMVAGLGTPWGETNGDGNLGGYHLVWARDLFKFANALITAGDRTTANAAVDYLFRTQMQTDDCGAAEYDASACAEGYSRVGRFPQNSWVSGWQYWQGTQMDESSMPIILAWRLGRTDLWPQIKLAADFVAANGPWTQQERWEENSGYSPSTIAAEIAGLVCASSIARSQGDLDSARRYLAKADEWQQHVTAWTFTNHGYHGNGRYYFRINDNQDPEDGHQLQVKNGGGSHDERYIVDGGFLELVRLGVKRADDWSILETLPEYDTVLKQDIPGKGPAWFRYNYDGYGEKNDGSNFDGAGRGRLWPIFTAERGMYEIARAGNIGSTGTSYINAVRAFSTPEGFVPEQVWNTSVSITGWQTTTPADQTPGTPTRSMGPLSWAMGEYINLMASIASNKIVDVPTVVSNRYAAASVLPAPGQGRVKFAVTANTQLGQYVYVAGNTAGLGNWDPQLGIPVDPTTYPVWVNWLNFTAGSQVQYKYVRKNADGTWTWESLPGNGNRTLTAPASGSTMTVQDSVTW